MDDIAGFTLRVHPTQTIDAVPSDPDGNRILECAVASASRFIVSGDIDLLRLRSYADIPIIKAADFLKLLPSL